MKFSWVLLMLFQKSLSKIFSCLATKALPFNLGFCNKGSKTFFKYIWKVTKVSKQYEILLKHLQYDWLIYMLDSFIKQKFNIFTLISRAKYKNKKNFCLFSSNNWSNEENPFTIHPRYIPISLFLAIVFFYVIFISNKW